MFEEKMIFMGHDEFNSRVTVGDLLSDHVQHESRVLERGSDRPRRLPSAGNGPRCPPAYPRTGAAPARAYRQMRRRGKAVAHELAEILRRVVRMHIADHFNSS